MQCASIFFWVYYKISSVDYIYITDKSHMLETNAVVEFC